MNPSVRYIAFCGIDCTLCAQNQLNCPEGCLGEIVASHCQTCQVRKCNLERRFENCARCVDFPCHKLTSQYSEMKKEGYGDWAEAANNALDGYHRASSG